MAAIAINKSFYANAGSTPGVRTIDDQTAADLELDEVFAGLDLTYTTPGQSALYALMRSTPMGRAEYASRHDRIRFYRDRPALSDALRKHLRKAGKQTIGDAAHELFDFPDLGLAKYRLLIAAWVYLTLASFVAPVFFGSAAFLFVVMPIALLNLFVYIKTTGRISVHSPSFHYIGLMTSLSGRIRKLRGFEESEELARLASLYPKIKRVSGPATFLKPVTSFGGDIIDMGLMYIKIFMLGELYNYLKAASIIRDAGNELRSMYETVGCLDAMCSLAALGKEADAPIAARVAFGENRIAALEARHPLVEACVPVSFSFDRGVILTGTNMSGKSTFLRTLGINQILATNLGIAYAASFETDLYFVSSSIRSEDDRASGKSRYLAEAERLLEIIAAIRAAAPPVLALIDEILNGTNSQDRISASIAILKGAAGLGSIVVAATHDIEIASALQGVYSPYYFSERIEDARLVFDFALREGIVDRKNAIRLLRLIGFGDDILGEE